MFSHVMIGANDLEASRKFYDAVLGTLGIAPPSSSVHGASMLISLGFILKRAPTRG